MPQLIKTSFQHLLAILLVAVVSSVGVMLWLTLFAGLQEGFQSSLSDYFSTLFFYLIPQYMKYGLFGSFCILLFVLFLEMGAQYQRKFFSIPRVVGLAILYSTIMHLIIYPHLETEALRATLLSPVAMFSSFLNSVIIIFLVGKICKNIGYLNNIKHQKSFISKAGISSYGESANVGEEIKN